MDKIKTLYDMVQKMKVNDHKLKGNILLELDGEKVYEEESLLLNQHFSKKHSHRCKGHGHRHGMHGKGDHQHERKHGKLDKISKLLEVLSKLEVKAVEGGKQLLLSMDMKNMPIMRRKFHGRHSEKFKEFLNDIKDFRDSKLELDILLDEASGIRKGIINLKGHAIDEGDQKHDVALTIQMMTD